MKRTLFYLLPLAFFSTAYAAEDGSEARLREALKSTMLQLRTAQSDTAKAQSEAIVAGDRAKTAEAKVAELEQRIQALTKQSNEDKSAAEKNIAGLNNRLAEREKRIADYTVALDKWKSGYDSLTAVAKTTEGERSRLNGEVISLKRTVEDRERKNIALFTLSTEILSRYENYSMGKSLAAKEPFIGTARVQLENQVQGYKDRILENRLSAPAPKP